MIGITVQVSGLNQLLKAIKDKAKDVQEEVSIQLIESANEMVNGAAGDAPVDMGILRNEITVKKVDNLNYEVVSQADYSAYVEFGTKSQVEIPPGLEQVAAQFRGKHGSSGEAKKFIYDWCKRKGIPEEAWFNVYRSIMVKGVKPHPFFFKQLEKEAPKLIQNIKNII